LIGVKLIAPAVGAAVVSCALAFGVTPPSSGATPPSGSSAPGGVTGATAPGGATVLASQVSSRNVLLDHSVAVSGTLEPSQGLDTVVLQERTAAGWRTVGETPDVIGGFLLRFRPNVLGLHAMRLRIVGATGVATVSTPSVDVFHKVLASWYGLGGRTACGQELTTGTLGVANKTLPCGTRVTLHYRHRWLQVPVIDRGPYVAGRAYDLTYATKRALGAGDLTEVWANH